MFHWRSLTVAEVGTPVLQEFCVKLLVVMVNSNGLTDFARINLLQSSLITKCSNKLGHLIHQICKKVSVALQRHVTCEAQLQKGDLTPNILSRIEAIGLSAETASLSLFNLSYG
jgi:hypothetical protein